MPRATHLDLSCNLLEELPVSRIGILSLWKWMLVIGPFAGLLGQIVIFINFGENNWHQIHFSCLLSKFLLLLFVCIIHIFFCQLWANWTSQREGSVYRGTQAMPYSFEPSGSFTYHVYSTDTWDLSLKSRLTDMVQLGIELTTLALDYGPPVSWGKYFCCILSIIFTVDKSANQDNVVYFSAIKIPIPWGIFIPHQSLMRGYIGVSRFGRRAVGLSVRLSVLPNLVTRTTSAFFHRLG